MNGIMQSYKLIGFVKFFCAILISLCSARSNGGRGVGKREAPVDQLVEDRTRLSNGMNTFVKGNLQK